MARQREVEVEEDDVVDQQDTTTAKDVDEAEAARKSREAARKSREAVFGKRDSDDDFDDEQEDSRVAYDEETGDRADDRGAASRRQRRNRARRERRNQDAEVIAASNERIARLEAALEHMNRSQLGLAAGGIDAQINEARSHIAQIGDVIAKAVSDGDGVKVARAMALRDEANARLMGLGAERQRLEYAARQGGQQPREQAQDQRPLVEVDPDAKRYSETFMDRHPWFDPQDPEHEDSQIVKSIDDTLVNQGYKPNTARYWKELERRVEKRGLGKDDGDVRDDYDDDYGDERPRRRERSDRNGGLPPRSRRGGSGGGNRSEAFDERRLPRLAKETLEHLGLFDKAGLDENQLKERESYIKQWRSGLKAAADRGEKV